MHDDGNNAAAARRADYHHGLAVARDDRRTHRAQRPLARRDRIGLALHQSVKIRNAELGGEVVHLVVEQDSGLRGGDLGAEPVVERIRHRHGVAFTVDDRIVRRVGAFVRRHTGFQVARDARLGRVDRSANLLGVALVQQAIERVLHEVRIAEIAVAIDVRMPHGLYLVVHRLRGAKPEILQRIALEDVEDLADNHSAGAWRRRRHDVVAAIVAFDRCELAHLVLLQIGLADDAISHGARSRDRLGDRALVKCFGAAPGDQAQCFRQILLHQPIAGLIGLSLVEKDRGGRGIVLEVVGGRGEKRDVPVVEREAALGKADSRCDQRAARARAVLGPCVFEAGHAAGDGDGQMTFGAQALDHVPCAVQIHVRRSGERRLFPEVDKGLASVGKLDGHEPAAAQIARGGIDHGERVADGYCGIDCIAAVL